MTMSKDRVRFTLPPRYFQGGTRRQNGFSRGTMLCILWSAFGMTNVEGCELMTQHPDGFEVECRPSQFARFIVLRYQANEGINGIRDLEPKMGPPTEHKDIYERVSDTCGLSVIEVKNVARLLHGYMNHDQSYGFRPSVPKLIDVSQRQA